VRVVRACGICGTDAAFVRWEGPGKLAGPGKIGVAVGKVIYKYKVGKHFDMAITPPACPSPAAGPDRRRGRPGV
jgi:threonine dehydrogenase-like Zn-dependent dehydrogenase